MQKKNSKRHEKNKSDSTLNLFFEKTEQHRRRTKRIERSKKAAARKRLIFFESESEQSVQTGMKRNLEGERSTRLNLSRDKFDGGCDGGLKTTFSSDSEELRNMNGDEDRNLDKNPFTEDQCPIAINCEEGSGKSSRAEDDTVSRKCFPRKITIQEIAQDQEVILTPRRERMRLFQIQSRKLQVSCGGKGKRKENESHCETRRVTVEEKWLEDLKTLSRVKPDFFSSDEAIMKKKGQLEREVQHTTASLYQILVSMMLDKAMTWNIQR